MPVKKDEKVVSPVKPKSAVKVEPVAPQAQQAQPQQPIKVQPVVQPQPVVTGASVPPAPTPSTVIPSVAVPPAPVNQSVAAVAPGTKPEPVKPEPAKSDSEKPGGPEVSNEVIVQHSAFSRFIIESVKFKCLVLIAMLATIVFFFYTTLSTFNSTDPIPAFQIIDEAKQKAFGAFTVKVKTGMFIRNFPQFDMIKNNFLVDCIIWFEFPSDEIMLDTIGQFNFENGKIVSKSAPDIKINDGRTFVKYEIRAEFKSNLTYHKFPFEDHRLTIVLANNFVTPSEAIFLIDNNSFVVAPNIFISNWIVKDLATDTGYQSSSLDSKDDQKQALYPLVSYTMKFAKAGIRKVLIIYIPLFFALLLALFSFVVTVENLAGRATLSVSAVTALLGYRFVIENMMPEVGYFTTTDLIYILLLLISLLVFVIQIILGTFKVDLKPNPYFREETINTIIFLVIVVIVTAATGYLVLR